MCESSYCVCGNFYEGLSLKFLFCGFWVLDNGESVELELGDLN